MQIKVFAKCLRLHLLPFEHCVKDKISLLPKVNNISVARSHHYSPRCSLIYSYVEKGCRKKCARDNPER